MIYYILKIYFKKMLEEEGGHGGGRWFGHPIVTPKGIN
jgi:hypothetical protein